MLTSQKPDQAAKLRHILEFLVLIPLLAMAGCSAGQGSGGNGNAVSVTITNKITSVTAGATAVTFSATVQNGNNGVTWTLTANGASCSPTCGSLSGATATSVTYTPPASAPSAPNNQPSAARPGEPVTFAAPVTSATPVAFATKDLATDQAGGTGKATVRLSGPDGFLT